MLLLDEPFGALDAKVRKELRRWLRRLHDEVHVTSVFVTHDQEEAMEVADRIVVMNQGRIEQDGAPDEVYDHPATPFVLQFLGDVNLFHGRARRGAGGARATPTSRYVRPHELQVVADGRAGLGAGDAGAGAHRRPEHAPRVPARRRLRLRRRRDAACRVARAARAARPEAGLEARTCCRAG